MFKRLWKTKSLFVGLAWIAGGLLLAIKGGAPAEGLAAVGVGLAIITGRDTKAKEEILQKVIAGQQEKIFEELVKAAKGKG